MLQKWNKIFRYLIVTGLIVLVLLSVYYKYGDCDKCKFEYENDTLTAAEFMEAYYIECLEQQQITFFNPSLEINVSG